MKIILNKYLKIDHHKNASKLLTEQTEVNKWALLNRTEVQTISSVGSSSELRITLLAESCFYILLSNI